MAKRLLRRPATPDELTIYEETMRVALDDALHSYYEQTRGKGHKFTKGEPHDTIPNATIYYCKLCNAFILRTARNVTGYKALAPCYSRFKPLPPSDDVLDELEELINAEVRNVQGASEETPDIH